MKTFHIIEQFKYTHHGEQFLPFSTPKTINTQLSIYERKPFVHSINAAHITTMLLELLSTATPEFNRRGEIESDEWLLPQFEQ